MSVDELNNRFFAGDYLGNIVMYNLTTGAVLKMYGKLEIGPLISSTRLNNLHFFVGNNSSFLVINDDNDQIIIKQYNTPIFKIKSIESFEVNDTTNTNTSNFFLIVSGSFFSPSYDKSDVLNITSLVNKYCNLPILKNKLTNDLQNTIKIQANEIIQLEKENNKITNQLNQLNQPLNK